MHCVVEPPTTLDAINMCNYMPLKETLVFSTGYTLAQINSPGIFFLQNKFLL